MGSRVSLLGDQIRNQEQFFLVRHFFKRQTKEEFLVEVLEALIDDVRGLVSFQNMSPRHLYRCEFFDFLVLGERAGPGEKVGYFLFAPVLGVETELLEGVKVFVDDGVEPDNVVVDSFFTKDFHQTLVEGFVLQKGIDLLEVELLSVQKVLVLQGVEKPFYFLRVLNVLDVDLIQVLLLGQHLQLRRNFCLGENLVLFEHGGWFDGKDAHAGEVKLERELLSLECL